MFAASKSGAVQSAPKDAQFNYVTMLLHGDGTNGAQNNTFLDSSSNAFTITRYGNTTQGSFSPYGSNWSNNFPSTGMYLTVGSNLSLGYSDYTIEFWFAGSTFELSWGTPGGYAPIAINSAGALYFANSSNTGWQAYISLIITDGSWNHYAIVRQSGSFKVFRNGVLLGTPAGPSGNTDNGNVVIGSYGTGSIGYVSNFRAVIGSAVYTSAFTPSTVPLTAITNTALLTCQSNRFVDNSSNAYSITPTGTPSVQRFNPFGTSTAYSTATIGGSGCFDGTGDYLDINTSGSEFNFGTGNLTIEFWAQQLADTYYQGVACITYNGGNPNNGYFDIELSPARGFYVSADALSLLCQSSTAVTAGDRSWHHWAICRSGTTWYLFKDGVALTKTTDTIGGANLTGTNGCIVGAQVGSGASPGFYYFNGNICDFRVIKGTALYTTNFTPPTAPLTAVSNTQLLCNFQNGAIYDNAMMNDLETVGNAQISTSVKKYGTGSLAFDGTGDYLATANNNLYNFGAGNFTIECWVYTGSPSSTAVFLNNRTVAAPYAGFTMATVSGNFTFCCTSNGSSWDIIAVNTPFGAVATNTWQHVAVVRNGNSFTGYVNGVGTSLGTSSAAILANTNNLNIGGDVNANWLNGYIDDLRITKGYARYTTNFTPPTSAFPNTGPN